jgi:hypothetical protein
MKFLLGTIVVILLAAAATGFVCYRMSCDAALHAAATKGDTMAWLRADFHLTDAQLAEVRKLQADYAPSCEEHCRRIQAARKALVASAADPSAQATAEQNLRELRAVCESALTRHVRQVAAVMSPDDGRRYLEMVLPKIANFDHTAAPDLQLNHSH